MDETKGNQKNLFGGMGKAIGAVSKIGKGTMTGTTKLAQRGLKAVSTAAHAATSHSAHDESSEEEVDDEERDIQVNELFKSIQLQGGSPHSQLVVAVAKGKLATDYKLVNINWFRVGSDSDESLASAAGSTYQPSVDDIGTTIRAQCFDLRNPIVCKYFEIGPLTPDGSLVAAVDGILKQKLYQLPMVELKVAPKWATQKIENVPGRDEETSPKKVKEGEVESVLSGGGGLVNQEERSTSNEGIPPTLKIDEEEAKISKLTVHKVSIKLTPRGLMLSACESDTPRGLHFILKESTQNQPSQHSVSLLDGYDNEEQIKAKENQEEPVTSKYIPIPSVIIHPEDPLRVDMVFTLDVKRGKWGGLEWFGDHGGELWGYMDFVRDTSSNSKLSEIISHAVESHAELLSVTLQLYLPDPHTRDVFTVAARSFTTSADSSDGSVKWELPWSQYEKKLEQLEGSEEAQQVGEDLISVHTTPQPHSVKDQSPELQLAIDHLKGDVARAKAETSRAKEEIDALKAQLAQSRNTALQSSKQLTVIEGELDTYKKKASEASKKASNKLKDMKETLAKSETAQHKAVERANEAEKMAAGIEARLHERVKEAEEKANQMKLELAAKSETCDKLKNDVSHWRRKAESLKKEVERGRKTEELAGTLSKELEEEKEKNTKLEAAIEVARQEGAAYKQAMEHALTVTEIPTSKGSTLGTMFRRKSDAEVPRPNSAHHN